MRPLKPIRVLVADDSPLIREWLVEQLALQPGIEVAGTAADGLAAVEAALRLSPDVITMDLRMPAADGFEAIARIMAERPTPILALTGEPAEPNTFRALSAGALDLLQKPSSPGEERTFAETLAARLRLLAATPVIRHVRGRAAPRVAAAPSQVELVAIAASLGGPRALGRVLKALPATRRAPVVVVQHMADGFIGALTRWLTQECGHEVREARHGEPLVPGPILFAPTTHHLLVRRGRVELDDGPPQHGFRPSASPLFRSAAAAFGAAACGVVLTGMGDDGADGLLEIHRAGGLTVAQDEASCAVFGMPRAAIRAGAVGRVLPLDGIATLVAEALA